MSISQRMRVDGRTALVTGGSRGIGRAIALGLAEFGADVAITCESRLIAAEEVAAEMRALGRRAAAFQVSLADPDGPQRTFASTVAALGKVDILVLNASLQQPSTWLEITR